MKNNKELSVHHVTKCDIAQEQGSSSWLTVLPVKLLGFNLSKLDFWDAVRLRYGIPLKKLLSNCACSKPYNVQHAISWKKGRFVTLRHNELRGKIAERLEEVTSGVKVEPALQTLSGEEIKGSQCDKARSDIEDFGLEDREHSLTSEYFNPSAQRQQSKTLQKY